MISYAWSILRFNFSRRRSILFRAFQLHKGFAIYRLHVVSQFSSTQFLLMFSYVYLREKLSPFIGSDIYHLINHSLGYCIIFIPQEPLKETEKYVRDQNFNPPRLPNTSSCPFADQHIWNSRYLHISFLDFRDSIQSL